MAGMFRNSLALASKCRYIYGMSPRKSATRTTTIQVRREDADAIARWCRYEGVNRPQLVEQMVRVFRASRKSLSPQRAASPTA